MQQNYMNSQQPYVYPQMNPNAVNINIISPQAYGTTNSTTNPINNSGFYSLYGQNSNPNLPLYPVNYNNLALQQNGYNYPNNLIQNPQQATSQQYMPQQNPMTQPTQAHQGFYTDSVTQPQNQGLNGINDANMLNSANLIQKTQNSEITNTEEENKTKTKKITPLTDDYIKSLENYMNNENPKIRLIGAKEMLERFKEDENRKDNPSLMPLLNKALKDSSPTVRFLGLTILQLEYAVGNDETVAILKEIQSQNKDKIGEDQLLASEILLKMSAEQKVEVPMTQKEIQKEQEKQAQKKGADK